MAFNAGAIEATLTLNRNPFTAGLAAARKQARDFANERYEATARIKVDQVSFNAAVKQLKDFAKNSRNALAKVNVDRLLFDKLVKDLRDFGRQTYTATARVNVADSNSQLRGLINLLNRSGTAADNNSRRFTSFGNQTHRAFSHADGGVRLMLSTLPLLLPVAGSAITGVIGLVGALTSILVTAGAGAAAFGLVAIPVFTRIKDAVAAGQAEIDKLPPGLRQAATALQGVTSAYNDLVTRTQTPVGFAMAAGFDAATAALRTLDPVIISMSTALTRMGREAEQYFNGAHWRNFVDFLSDEMLPVWMGLWDIVKYLTRAVMDLTVAFMPLAQWLLEAIASGMKEFSQWASTLAGDPQFHRWLELVKESLTQVWRFLVEVVKFLFNLATALAPIGNVVLGVLTAIFQGLNKLPPEWLAAIAMGISAIFTAMIFGASPQVALAIGAVTALAIGFTELYKSSQPLREMIDRIWSDIQTRFIPVFRDFWHELQDKVLPAVRDLKSFFETEFLPAFEKFYFAVAPILEWLMRVVGTELVETFRAAIMMISGLLQTLTGVLQLVAGILTLDWRLMWEGLKNIGEGALNTILSIFGVKMSDIVHYFQNDFGPQFKAAWEGTWNTLGTWWNDYFITPMNSTWQTFLDGLNTMLGLEKETIETEWAIFWDAVSTKAIEIWDDLKSRWDDFWTGPGSVGAVLEGETPKIKTEWDDFWAGLNTKYNEVTEGISTGWHEFWVGLFDGMGQDGEAVAASWNQWWIDRQIGADQKMKEMETGWINFWGTIGEWFATESAKVGESWNIFWDGVGTKAKQVWDDLGVWWSDFWRSHIDPTLQAEIDAFNGKWNEFWDGVFTKATQIWNDLKTWWNEYWGSQQATQDTGEAESTQSWGDFWGNLGFTLGNWIREQSNAWVGFWGGVRTEQDGRQTEVEGSWNAFWRNVETTARDIWNNITSGWNGFLTGLETSTRDAVAKIGSAFRAIGNMFRDPINWVIRVVINDGILAGWNTVMGWVGAPGIAGRVGELPSFAQGGAIRGPGSGTSDSILAMVSNGEYIIPAAIAQRHYHFLEALRNGQAEAVVAAGGGNNPNAYPRYAVGGQIDAGLNFARSQVGKPYQWGGVGPSGYDCSGIISAVTNVMLGRGPHSRLGSTGSAPWGGWTPGLNSAFGVGYFKGNPGHMAGTLAGTNIESSGGAGVRMGNGRGATDGMFSGHMSLPQVGGQFVGGAAAEPVSWWSIIGPQVEALFKALIPTSIPGAAGPVGAGMLDIPAQLITKVIDGARTKLEKMMTSAISTIGNIIDVGVGAVAGALDFDSGGVLNPGATSAFNGTGEPEAVLTKAQWDAVMSDRVSTDDANILRKLDELIEILDRKKLDVTVNVDKDGKATTHGDALALRLGRR